MVVIEDTMEDSAELNNMDDANFTEADVITPFMEDANYEMCVSEILEFERDFGDSLNASHAMDDFYDGYDDYFDFKRAPPVNQIKLPPQH